MSEVILPTPEEVKFFITYQRLSDDFPVYEEYDRWYIVPTIQSPLHKSMRLFSSNSIFINYALDLLRRDRLTHNVPLFVNSHMLIFRHEQNIPSPENRRYDIRVGDHLHISHIGPLGHYVGRVVDEFSALL